MDHWEALFVAFLMIVFLIDKRGYLIVVLISTSLIISDVEVHVSIGHLHVFFGKYLFRSSADILNFCF